MKTNVHNDKRSSKGDLNSHGNTLKADPIAAEPDDETSEESRSPSNDPRREKDIEELSPTSSEVSVAKTLSPFREFLFVCVICLAQLLTQAGLGQTLSILHIIGDSFGITNEGELAWLIAGYSLTVGTFILMSGRLGDLFGYKRMLLIGFSWFAVWSMVAGLAVYSNKVLFIFARVLTGIGPSICLPNALAILGITYKSGPKKNLTFALFGAVAPGGAVLGSASGGLFAQLVWWPWTFWSLAITLVCTVAVGALVIPDDPRPKREHRMTFREFIIEADVGGAILGITALVLVNFAWNQASFVGWDKPYVYILLIIGLFLVPLFFYWEFRVAKHPLVPFDVINAEVGFVLACIACGWGCFGIWVFYYYQFVEELRDATPLQAAAWLSPTTVAGAIAALLTGWLLGRVRPAWVMMMAMTAFLVGVTLLATSPVDQIYWSQTFVHTLIVTFGMDMSFPSGAIILSDAVPKEHQGVGMSLVNTVVNYSISLALGFAGTMDLYLEHGDRSRSALLKDYRSAWYLAIGLAGLGMILAAIFLVRSYVKKSI